MWNQHAIPTRQNKSDRQFELLPCKGNDFIWGFCSTINYFCSRALDSLLGCGNAIWLESKSGKSVFAVIAKHMNLVPQKFIIFCIRTWTNGPVHHCAGCNIEEHDRIWNNNGYSQTTTVVEMWKALKLSIHTQRKRHETREWRKSSMHFVHDKRGVKGIYRLFSILSFYVRFT